MKIEKVNDHQIRCTLTKDDLANREIKLSELAYGTEKAKDLFRDMMQQASFQYGFEAEDIPLMIEAIPLNADCIVLIITKVEDPEELDTRFSKFAPSVHEDNQDLIDEAFNNISNGADDVIDLFNNMREAKFGSIQEHESEKISSNITKISSNPIHSISKETVLTKLYSFPTIRELTTVSKILNGFYRGKSSLFKNTQTGKYSLIIQRGAHTPEEYNKICNILSEYGALEKYTIAIEAFMKEHCELIIKDSAVQSLSLV